MLKLIEYLNEMLELGLISKYSLGSDTALIYYFEPIQTQDIDVFVLLKQYNNELINLSPIYSFLSSKSAEAKGEYVVIENIPIQFLVPYNSLVEEAVEEARQVKFSSADVFIPPLEYLMAIMVQTGRTKDKARLEELLKQPDLFDYSRFEQLVSKFGLTTQLEKIKAWLKS